MNNILIPVLAHIIWCALLYALLTLARAPVVWGIGADTNGQNPFEHIKQSVSANLSNQFEWPMFFHMLCIVLYTSSLEVSNTMFGLAWVFIAGRILHSIVQIFGKSIRLRGVVFSINFLAVLAMWFLFMMNTVQ